MSRLSQGRVKTWSRDNVSMIGFVLCGMVPTENKVLTVVRESLGILLVVRELMCVVRVA